MGPIPAGQDRSFEHGFAAFDEDFRIDALVSANAPWRHRPDSSLYFVIVCLVGVTVDVGAAFEIAKVSQTFQPSGRFSAPNSL
jgi:hypothetical protein